MQNEEAKRDKKTYDRTIIRWLYGFTRGYRPLMLLALLFMLITALLELSIPIVTKIAVDKYIYPSWRITKFSDNPADKLFKQEIIKKYPSLVIPLENENYLIDISEIDNEDRHNLERLERISDHKYLFIDINSLSDSALRDTREIIKKHTSIFLPAEKGYYINYDSLKEISAKDLRIIRSDEIRHVIKLGAILFLCLLGIFIFSSFFTYILYYSGHKIMHLMRISVFSHILKLPQNYFDKNPVGRLTTRVTNDINAINDMYTSVMVQFVKDVLVVVGVFIVMFHMNRELTFYVFILTVLMAFFAGLFRMKLKTVYRDLRRSIAKLNSFVQESIKGIILIKLYSREMANFEKFQGVNQENFKANMDQLWVYATFRPFIEFTSVFTIAFILWYGGIEVIGLDLTLGALIAYLYYARMLFRPIMELAEKYNIFQSAAAATENLYEISNVPAESVEGINHGDIRGELEFKNVWFSYNDKEWVLKDVSFKISEGETVALVGLTGSGKTTIVNLILKFYDIQKGVILFNGVDIRNYSPEYLREHISAVFQDLFLFGKNIGDGDSFDSRQLSHVIDLEDLYDSDINSMSSGEKQLVSLLSALSKKSNLLILDEATSNIDANIEQKFQETLRYEKTGRSTLIIAHRLSNVKNADRIFVIHKGEISESGTHSKLLAKKGIYYNLYQLQNEIQNFSLQ